MRFAIFYSGLGVIGMLMDRPLGLLLGPGDAIELCRALAPCRLLFLEEPGGTSQPTLPTAP